MVQLQTEGGTPACIRGFSVGGEGGPAGRQWWKKHPESKVKANRAIYKYSNKYYESNSCIKTLVKLN